MFDNVQYYVFYCSAALFYGIGLSHVVVIGKTPSEWPLKFIKALICIPVSTVLSWLLIQQILIPYDLSELYPLVCVLVFISVSVFSEIFIRITTGRSSADFSVSLLCVLLAINESTQLLEAFLLSMYCILAFYILLPFVYSLDKRIEIVGPMSGFRKDILILLSLAAVMIILNARNISWLTPGVIQ